MNYSEVLRQGLGQWSPNGRYLAGAQQHLGPSHLWDGALRNRLQIRDPDSLKLLQAVLVVTSPRTPAIRDGWRLK